MTSAVTQDDANCTGSIYCITGVNYWSTQPENQAYLQS